jgi:hypothetical protein
MDKKFETVSDDEGPMAKLNKLRGKQGNSSVGPNTKKNAQLVNSSPATGFKQTLNKSSSNRALLKNTNSVEKVYTKNFLMSLSGAAGIGPNLNKKHLNLHKGSIISSNQSVNSRFQINLNGYRPNNNPFNDI